MTYPHPARPIPREAGLHRSLGELSGVRRLTLAIWLVGVLVVPAAARADDPSSACGPITCVTAHPHAEVGCGADGRDPSVCTGTLTYTLGFDSPLPVESIDYMIDLTCSVECAGAGSRTGTCGWMPPEVRPIGETGCSIGDVITVGFTADVPSGFCATYRVEIVVSARAVLDPFAELTDTAADAIEFCAP